MKTQLLLILSAAFCGTQSPRTQWSEGDGVKGRCSNLTLVLDNWRFAIMTQVKDLLLHDHDTVLPEYGRIQRLSDALADLYQEFNSLKQRLSELTTQFDGVESFVDDVRSGGGPSGRDPSGGSWAEQTRTTGRAPAAGGGAPGRKSRVVIWRVVRPVIPQQ